MTIQPFLSDTLVQYRRVKSLVEDAVTQVNDDAFFRDSGADTNSIAIIIKHMAGNMRSRWTDFLTTDGEKPDRDRDSEFELRPGDTRTAIMGAWDAGWETVFAAFETITDDHLDATVLIRGEAHTVPEAILRQLRHYAYHAGQVVLLAKIAVGPSWETLSIARGQSEVFNEAMRRGSERHG